jgi:hypothetical protein
MFVSGGAVCGRNANVFVLSFFFAHLKRRFENPESRVDRTEEKSKGKRQETRDGD